MAAILHKVFVYKAKPEKYGPIVSRVSQQRLYEMSPAILLNKLDNEAFLAQKAIRREENALNGEARHTMRAIVKKDLNLHGRKIIKLTDAHGKVIDRIDAVKANSKHKRQCLLP